MSKVNDPKLLEIASAFVNDKFGGYRESIPIECETCGLPKDALIEITDGREKIYLSAEKIIDQIGNYLINNYSVEVIELMLKKAEL